MMIIRDTSRILGTLSVMCEVNSKHEFVKNKVHAAGILLGVCNAAVCRKGSCARLRQSRT